MQTMDVDYADNATWEEVEPFNPYEYEERNLYESIYFFVQTYLMSTIKTVLCVFVLANNALLIFVICKFKRLQTKTNYIILNFAVTTSFYSMFNTILTLADTFLYLFTYVSRFVHTLCLDATLVLLQVSFLLASLLGLDWFISANFKNMSSQYQKFYKWIIILIYLIPISINLLTIFFVYGEFFSIHIAALGVVIIYVIYMLTNAVINIIKYRKTYTQESLKTSYALYVSNIYFLMWLPLPLMLLLYLIASFHSHHWNFSVSVIFAIITYSFELFGFAAPIVIAVTLRKLDKNFKMSFDSIFKRSVRNYVQADDNDNINDDLSV